jgi:hypothetical protein
VLRINKVYETPVPVQGTVYAIFVKPLTFPTHRVRHVIAGTTSGIQ